MTIDALPTPPSTTDTANFDTRADAFMDALVNFVTQTNAVAVAMNLNSTTDTSATSNAIGTGSKTFTVSTGKSFQPGMYLVIADSAAASTNSMYVQVTSYNAGTGALVVDCVGIKGSGTKTAWTVSQSIPSGHLIGYYASGEVIQQLTFTDAGSSSPSGTFTNVTAAAKSITPKSTNSKILVECISNGTVTAGGAGNNTTGVTSLYSNDLSATFGNSSIIGVVSSGGTNVQSQGMFVNKGTYSNTTLAAKSFLLHAKYSTAACTVTAAEQVWTITEIQN